jgi:hypothetical protein
VYYCHDLELTLRATVVDKPVWLKTPCMSSLYANP